jgi:hypothetical protein
MLTFDFGLLSDNCEIMSRIAHYYPVRIVSAGKLAVVSLTVGDAAW